MGAELASPLHLKRGTGRPAPAAQFVKSNQAFSSNALMGITMWFLLWMGYNTGPGYIMDPAFPNNFVDLIHGVRAFFPELAMWFALLLIFARSNRLFYWIMGPLGLMLMYAITGLVSSITLSPDPVFAIYYGTNYLAIVIVLIAIVLVDDPLPDLRKVLTFTWIWGTLITLSLLGAIPFLGAQAVVETESSPIGVRAFGAAPQMGMSGTRNTGFARYAAISALVTIPWVMRKGNLFIRAVCGVALVASLYALLIANGRTETLAFVACLALILVMEKTKRAVNILMGIAVAILLGLRGFYSKFFLYITRTGRLTPACPDAP